MVSGVKSLFKVDSEMPKTLPNTSIEFGNNDFRNQRTQVSKNRYVAKKQTKMPVGGFLYSKSNRKSSLEC